MIGNASAEDHSFKVASLKDSELAKDEVESRSWEDLLDPQLASEDL